MGGKRDMGWEGEREMGRGIESLVFCREGAKLVMVV